MTKPVQAPPPRPAGSPPPMRPERGPLTIDTGMDQRALAEVWVGVWQTSYASMKDAAVADAHAEAAVRRFRNLLRAPLADQNPIK